MRGIVQAEVILLAIIGEIQEIFHIGMGNVMIPPDLISWSKEGSYP